MKIKINDTWCDTESDWGYKSDQEFATETFLRKQHAEKLNQYYRDIIADLLKVIDPQWLAEHPEVVEKIKTNVAKSAQKLNITKKRKGLFKFEYQIEPVK